MNAQKNTTSIYEQQEVELKLTSTTDSTNSSSEEVTTFATAGIPPTYE